MKSIKNKKKPLLISLLIAVSFLLVSCKWFESQPTPPVYKERWLNIGRTSDESYLYYNGSSGGAKERTYIKDIPFEPQSTNDVYVCVRATERDAIKAYERDMNKWIPKHCKN